MFMDPAQVLCLQARALKLLNDRGRGNVKTVNLRILLQYENNHASDADHCELMHCLSVRNKTVDQWIALLVLCSVEHATSWLNVRVASCSLQLQACMVLGLCRSIGLDVSMTFLPCSDRTVPMVTLMGANTIMIGVNGACNNQQLQNHLGRWPSQ